MEGGSVLLSCREAVAATADVQVETTARQRRKIRVVFFVVVVMGGGGKKFFFAGHVGMAAAPRASVFGAKLPRRRKAGGRGGGGSGDSLPHSVWTVVVPQRALHEEKWSCAWDAGGGREEDGRRHIPSQVTIPYLCGMMNGVM